MQTAKISSAKLVKIFQPWK